MNTENVKYCGIDVSKGYADFCLLDHEKQMIDKGFQLDDNRQGHEFLSRYLEGMVSAGGKVICGLESTGGYEQNWLSLCKKQSKKYPIEVFKLNPKGIKHQIESTLQRTITDGISARGIAEYLINNYALCQEKWSKNTHQHEAVTAKQHCYNLILGLIKQQTARLNQLEKLIYQMFPELIIFCKNGIPNWMLRLLIAYPGVSSIRRAQVRGINAIKGISLAKAEKIKQLAKESVSESSDEFEQVMIKTLAQDVQYHQNRIDQLKDHLVAAAKNDQTELICSIRGIADWTAVAIFLLLGDVSRFESTDQLACFFGIHPRFKQSGDGKWGMRMSKQGNPAMRAILYIAANNVVLHEPYFKMLYHHYISSGKKHRAVMGIIMHKLLRIIYGMLKNQTAFNANVDEANKTASAQSAQKKINETARRYQQLAVNAPISRSNHKKRRVDLECQISTEDIITASS
jgi:transposase